MEQQDPNNNTQPKITIEDKYAGIQKPITTYNGTLITLQNVRELAGEMPESVKCLVLPWIESHLPLIKKSANMSVVGTLDERKARTAQLIEEWKKEGQGHPYEWLLTNNNTGPSVQATVAAPGIRLGGHNRALQFYKKKDGVDPRAWNAPITEGDMEEITKKYGNNFHTYHTASHVAGWLLFEEAKRKWAAEHPGETFPVEVPNTYIVSLSESGQANFDSNGPLHDGSCVAFKKYPTDLKPATSNPQAVLNAKPILEYLASNGGAWQIYDENQLGITADGKVFIKDLQQPAETDPKHFPYTSQNETNIDPQLAKELLAEYNNDAREFTFHYGHAHWVKNDEQPKFFVKMAQLVQQQDQK